MSPRFRALLADFWSSGDDPDRAREIEWQMHDEMMLLPEAEQTALRSFLTGGLLGN